MQTVAVTRTVHAEPATVWNLIGDMTSVVHWHPLVARVDLLTSHPSGIGAARRCHFHDGTSVREVVTEVDEGRCIRIGMSEFKLPMKHFEAKISLRRVGDNETQATFEMLYEVKFGVLGRAMNFLMVRAQMRKLLASVLAGLDHHCVTGERVGKDFNAAA